MSVYVTFRLPKAGPWIDALVERLAHAYFFNQKKNPRLRLTNIVTTNQSKIAKKVEKPILDAVEE